MSIPCAALAEKSLSNHPRSSAIALLASRKLFSVNALADCHTSRSIRAWCHLMHIHPKVMPPSTHTNEMSTAIGSPVLCSTSDDAISHIMRMM